MDTMDKMDSMDPSVANLTSPPPLPKPTGEAELAAMRARNKLALEKVEKAKRRQMAWVALAGVAVLIGCWAMVNLFDMKGPVDDHRSDAHYMAEEFIKKQMVGAKEISSFRDSEFQVEGNTYWVGVTVEGLNVFGGPVRERLIVEMILSPTDNKWRLVKIHKRDPNK